MATVMVVDDEPEITDRLRILLEKDGHSVMEASNGQVALERMGIDPLWPDAPRPDLIILDIMMPVMNGYTLNVRLQSHPTTRSIPILMLTAKGQRMRDIFENSPNVAAYVQKPFDPKTLRELIAGIISR